MDAQNRYGVDVARMRVDDLDKKMIAWVEHVVKEERIPQVLDLGCGGGGQSVQLATAGATVVGFDIQDHTANFATLRDEKGLKIEQLEFMQGDITQLDLLLDGRQIDVCCFQRTIHYLPYDVACMVLKYLRKHVTDRLYISVTGIESAIGTNYTDGIKPVSERFSTLSAEDAETFRISAPVCLYTPEEFITLLQESGWDIDECWISAFGNIKAVCL